MQKDFLFPGRRQGPLLGWGGAPGKKDTGGAWWPAGNLSSGRGRLYMAPCSQSRKGQRKMGAQDGLRFQSGGGSQRGPRGTLGMRDCPTFGAEVHLRRKEREIPKRMSHPTGASCVF